MLLIGGGFLMCVRLQTSNLKVTTMFETYNVKNAQAKSTLGCFSHELLTFVLCSKKKPMSTIEGIKLSSKSCQIFPHKISS